MGTGAWALITDNGQTYELLNPPAALTATDRPVKVTGQVREGMMTIAMIGPVFEVSSFEVLN
jgi:hypothetical protein